MIEKYLGGFMVSYIEKTISYFKLEKKQTVYFLVLSFMSLLYVFPLIQADRYYNDDLSRSIIGATGWNGDGRPVAEIFMKLYEFGRPITDTFPLTMILGIIFYVYAMTLYIRCNMETAKLSLRLLYAGLLVLANPFFIPNMAVQFDCIFMLISVSLSLILYSLPFINPIVELITNMFFVSVILCIFQPSVSVWISLAFLEVLLSIIKKRGFFNRLLLRGAGGIIAATLYLAVIAPAFVDKKGWRAEAAHLSLSVIGVNFIRIINVIRRFLAGLTLPVIIPAVIFIILSIVIWVVTAAKNNPYEKKACKILVCIYAAVLPVILMLVAALPLTVLSQGNISEHVLVGIGVSMLYIGLGAVYPENKQYGMILTMVLIPILLFQYVYIYSYGNVADSQKKYETYIVQSIVSDIERADPEGECNTVDVIGSMPKSRQLQTACEKYPQFEAIIPVYIYPENWIGTALLNHYTYNELFWQEMSESEAAALSLTEPVSETAVYRLYKVDKKMVIDFYHKH